MNTGPIFRPGLFETVLGVDNVATRLRPFLTSSDGRGDRTSFSNLDEGFLRVGSLWIVRTPSTRDVPLIWTASLSTY